MNKIKNNLGNIIYKYINNINDSNKEIYCFLPSNTGLISHSYRQLLYSLILSKEEASLNSKNSYINMEIPILIEFSNDNSKNKIKNLSSLLEKLNDKNNADIINTGNYRLLFNDEIKNETSITGMFRNLFSEDRILYIKSLKEATIGLVDQEKYLNNIKSNPQGSSMLEYEIYNKYPELFITPNSGLLFIHVRIRSEIFNKLFDLDNIKQYLKKFGEEYTIFLESLFGTKDFNIKVYEYYEEYKKLNAMIEAFNKKGEQYQNTFSEYISKRPFIDHLSMLNYEIMNKPFEHEMIVENNIVDENGEKKVKENINDQEGPEEAYSPPISDGSITFMDLTTSSGKNNMQYVTIAEALTEEQKSIKDELVWKSISKYFEPDKFYEGKKSKRSTRLHPKYEEIKSKYYSPSTFSPTTKINKF